VYEIYKTHKFPIIHFITGSFISKTSFIVSFG